MSGEPDAATVGTDPTVDPADVTESVDPTEDAGAVDQRDGGDPADETRAIDTNGASDSVDEAIAAFRAGRPVCIHDAADREDEVDLVQPAAGVTTDDIARLRTDGGGLLFVALGPDVAAAFDLPYMHEVIDHPAADLDDLPYGGRPSFSLTVNHRDTYTGVTDRDRATTIAALGTAAATPDAKAFAAEFRSPGHVHLLRGAAGGLTDRGGHTELALALADAADREPAVAGCEMLDATTGDALAPGPARAYAERNEVPFVTGEQLTEILD